MHELHELIAAHVGGRFYIQTESEEISSLSMHAVVREHGFVEVAVPIHIEVIGMQDIFHILKAFMAHNQRAENNRLRVLIVWHPFLLDQAQIRPRRAWLFIPVFHDNPPAVVPPQYFCCWARNTSIVDICGDCWCLRAAFSASASSASVFALCHFSKSRWISQSVTPRL